MLDAAAMASKVVLAVMYLGLGGWLAWQARTSGARDYRGVAAALAAACAVALFGPWRIVHLSISIAVVAWLARVFAQHLLRLGRA